MVFLRNLAAVMFVVALPLLDGPAPQVAGVFMRRGAVLPEAARRLIDAARDRFAALTTD